MNGLFALYTYSDTVTTRQIDGSECQLDFLSCWHDNGDCTIPVIIPVVGWEVGRLDNTSSV